MVSPFSASVLHLSQSQQVSNELDARKSINGCVSVTPQTIISVLLYRAGRLRQTTIRLTDWRAYLKINHSTPFCTLLSQVDKRKAYVKQRSPAPVLVSHNGAWSQTVQPWSPLSIAAGSRSFLLAIPPRGIGYALPAHHLMVMLTKQGQRLAFHYERYATYKNGTTCMYAVLSLILHRQMHNKIRLVVS